MSEPEAAVQISKGDLIDELSSIASLAKAAELAANGMFYSSGEKADVNAIINVTMLVTDKLTALRERLEAEMLQVAHPSHDIDERDKRKRTRGAMRAKRQSYLAPGEGAPQ